MDTDHGDGAPTHTPSAPSHRTTRVVALMNQKGGVGKTTTTVNLAAALAEAGHETLVIDLDPQAHATLHLGVDPSSIEHSVYDLLTGDAASLAQARVPIAERLSIVPAETDLAAAETELAAADRRQHRLADALANLPDPKPNFVLLDCPPSLSLLTLNALTAADEVLMPMQAHFLALQGIGKLLETVRLVRQQLNDRLTVAGVVLCMHDKQATHTQEVVADIVDFFEAQRDADVPWNRARVLDPPIRRNIKLAECPSFGQTIFQYAPWAPGAADYRALADAFLAAIAETEAPPATPPATPAAPEVHVAGQAPAETPSA